MNNKPGLPLLNYKSSTRAVNDGNNNNVKFESTTNNNQRVNPSFKNIADFMQFNKKNQIRSSKSIFNSGNLSKIIPQQSILKTISQYQNKQSN